MSALRLTPSYPSPSTHSSQTHSLPGQTASFSRPTIPASSPLMDRNQTVPVPLLPTHYPSSLSRSVCSIAPQGTLASCPSQYTTTPGPLSLPCPPMLNSSALPLARPVAPHISNVHSPGLYPVLNPPLSHPSSAPGGYMGSAGVYHTPCGN